MTRAAAGLFAAGWLVFPGFGLIDLSVTWSADWPQALEAGWGLFSTLIVGAAFAVVGLRPRLWPTAAPQLALAAAALAISAAAAREPRLLWFAGALAVQAVVVAALARRERTTGLTAPRAVLVAACIGTGPWLVYALHMWSLNRRGEPVDVTIGVDHYAMQGALALVLAFLPVLVVRRAQRPAFAPACFGVAASYLALVSLARPDAAGSVSRTWSLAMLCWGLAVLGAALARRFRVVTAA